MCPCIQPHAAKLLLVDHAHSHRSAPAQAHTQQRSRLLTKSGFATGLRTITILPPDKSKGPRCTAMGTADGASLLLDPIVVLSGPPVAWLAPIEAAMKLAVKISIQQAMSDGKRAKKDAWVRNAFLQAAIVSSRITFTVRTVA